jgi:GH43 family beta-xylosidase
MNATTLFAKTLRRLAAPLLLAAGLAGAHASWAQPAARSIPNPVLEGVADAGVLEHRGTYYLMGVGTGGDLYTSTDLVHWRGPEHAFSMDNDWTPGPAAEDRRIHANDFEYVGGTFHLYWSVNYWGAPQMTVHIGHATAASADGPYEEPVAETWFDSRIDPHLFIDEDGTPYFYSVKFTDGNVIYGQRMADPWTLVGEPRFLLSALPGTWEMRAQRDGGGTHRINEGPEVDTYRGRHYMLYAANPVSARWGQYAIGAAEAGGPLGFDNASKYARPVLGPTNEERLRAAADVIVPAGRGAWRYTTSDPSGANWAQAGYDDSAWKKGPAAFGSRTVDGSTTNRTRTRWETPDLWMRKTFQLDAPSSEHAQLLMRLRGAAEVYVNGERIHRSDGVRNYATIDVGDTGAFRAGKNVLAVHARRAGAQEPYVDVGLFNPQEQPGEAYVFSPGQPNLVRGPNGFEWWLVYFARFDGGGKSQAVDRVHFFDQRLHVAGPTGPHTPGYHPPPRPPTFEDRFERALPNALGTAWELRGEGRWRVRGGEGLQRRETGTAQALIGGPAGTHYRFEASVRMAGGRAAGMVAFQDEGGDRLTVSLDREAGAWTYQLRENGAQMERSFALPEDFDFEAYHAVRVTRNGDVFRVALDGRPAPGTPVIETGLSEKGRPGLHTRGASAAFDGVTHTRGWDEYDARIRGWQATGTDTWRTDSTGLRQTARTGARRVLKGDPLSAYEFSAQVYGDLRGDGEAVSDEDGGDEAGSEEARRAGFYPVYVDESNWLRAELDLSRHRLVVDAMRGGERAERRTVALTERTALPPDATYSGPFAKRYTLRSPTLISDLRVEEPPPGTGARPLSSSWQLAYRQSEEDDWTPLPQEVASGAASAEPALASALRVEVGAEGDGPGTLSARVSGKSTYNLRAVKRPGEVLLFVDGRQVMRVPGEWPAARVGLSTQGMAARFDGLLRFHIPTAGGARSAP